MENFGLRNRGAVVRSRSLYDRCVRLPLRRRCGSPSGEGRGWRWQGVTAPGMAHYRSGG